MPDPARNLDALTLSLREIAPTWRGRAPEQARAQPTGFSGLNEALAGGGWPIGALTELIPTVDGIGEVRLTLPALRQMCRAQRRIVFIDPPFTPDPPALYGRGLPLALTLWVAAKTDNEGLWAAAQLLRERSTGAVLLWSERPEDRMLRKLQLAAETGHALAFLFRRPEALQWASPAALRLELRPASEGLDIQVHKARGANRGAVTVRLPKIRL